MFTPIVMASVVVAAPMSGHEVEQMFLTLEGEVDERVPEVSYSSNVKDYVRQPSFRAIVALGPRAIPQVIKRMEQYLNDKKILDAGKVPKKFDPCPWEQVFLEITKYRLNEDADYRDKVRRYYEKLGQPDLAKVVNPAGVSFIPEIAIPHLIHWWEKTGNKQFGVADPQPPASE
ncbi:MAG: hypothetical protein QM702_12500 [Rubrivivax sp.]